MPKNKKPENAPLGTGIANKGKRTIIQEQSRRGSVLDSISRKINKQRAKPKRK